MHMEGNGNYMDTKDFNSGKLLNENVFEETKRSLTPINARFNGQVRSQDDCPSGEELVSKQDAIDFLHQELTRARNEVVEEVEKYVKEYKVDEFTDDFLSSLKRE